MLWPLSIPAEWSPCLESYFRRHCNHRGKSRFVSFLRSQKENISRDPLTQVECTQSLVARLPLASIAMCSKAPACQSTPSPCSIWTAPILPTSAKYLRNPRGLSSQTPSSSASWGYQDSQGRWSQSQETLSRHGSSQSMQ